MAKMKSLTTHPLLLFAIALFFLPYLLVSIGSYVDLATDIIIWGLVAMAFNFVYGHTGDLSFGHGMFIAVSGYFAGNIAIHISSNLFLTIIVGVLTSTVVGTIVGLFAAYRSKGIYFAMITLAFGQVIFYLGYSVFQKYTGGENGLNGIPKPNIFCLNMQDNVVLYYVTAVFVFIGVFVLYRITKSPFGKVCRAIRSNSKRPEFLGYDVKKYRFKAFVISSALAGYAGVLNVYHIGYVSPFVSNWSSSGEIVMMSVLGGINQLFGPFLGALVYKYLEDILSTYTDYWFLPLGTIFVFFVLVSPTGISGLILSIKDRLLSRLHAKRVKKMDDVSYKVSERGEEYK